MKIPNPGTPLLYMAAADDTIHADRSQPLAAIIVYALGERLANLTVFDQQGNAHPRTNVVLIQEADPLPTDGTAYAGWSTEAPTLSGGMSPRATAVHLIGAVTGNVDDHIKSLHKLTQYIEFGTVPEA